MERPLKRLKAWEEFRRGKRMKQDVLEFQSDLIYQVTQLHQDLKKKTYAHGGYHHFRIADPKPRDIHKASVRDRLLHHALYRRLYPYFDTTFIYDSYSCRVGKGTHKAMGRFRSFAFKVSRNHTRTCWVLKCDIRKFFASIDHTYASGVDFLGWVHFADHRVLRTASKERMLRRLKDIKGQESEEATLQSYKGMLRHGNARTLEETHLSDRMGI